MLRLISKAYGAIADLRNRLYDLGTLSSYDLGVRTISIGNITAGGTGKTPLVAYVAEKLAERGEKVCILTRGYRRKNEKQRVLVSDGERLLADPETGGDEPVELAEKLLGKAMVVAHADRVSAGKWAKEEFGITVFILDDGFQHRRVKRDLDIVCVNARDPFGGREMLPAGRLREPLHNLARADVVVVSNGDLVDNIAELRGDLSDMVPNSPVFLCEKHLRSFVPVNGSDGDIDPAVESVFAFCGLADPDGFFGYLRRRGVSLAGEHAFDDHHVYGQGDADELERQAKSAGAVCMVTTAKDAVKIRELRFALPIFVAKIELSFDNAGPFDEML
jgi:tetraacyldisaccharide 4'-kinase